MISIAICDNESIYLDFYESKLNEIAHKLNLNLDITRFSSGESLLFYLEDQLNKFDLIYLDIVMDGINGIDNAMKIRQLNQFVKIVFLTSSKEFVYHAFDAHASNYLIKDLHDNKFDDVFMKVFNEIRDDPRQIALTIDNKDGHFIVPIKDVAYFESFQRIMICHKANKATIKYYYKMKDLSQELAANNFVLVHRSFLVNMSYILKLTKTDVYLKNGGVLPVSRNNYETVKDLLLKYTNQQSKRKGN